MILVGNRQKWNEFREHIAAELKLFKRRTRCFELESAPSRFRLDDRAGCRRAQREDQPLVGSLSWISMNSCEFVACRISNMRLAKRFCLPDSISQICFCS